MLDYNVVLPSKPRVIKEENFIGIYEIDGLYPGYGHTLGNSLRRIILSSLPGAAITSVKIDGVSHEFSTIEGIKEDVITIILNLKRVRLEMLTDEPQILKLKVKGAKEVTANDIELPGQINILNPDLHIAELTDKSAELNMELTVEKGLGYVSKEVLQKERVEIGTITLDANFTPIKRVNYEVEHMRVGTRTDFNRLKIYIETDGTVNPREALEKSIEIMSLQLKAIIGFKEEEEEISSLQENTDSESEEEKDESEEDQNSKKISKEAYDDVLKTRTDTLDLSQRTVNALTNANIRTVGGIARKKEKDLLEIEGLGSKGVKEIKKSLGNFGITLKE
ncbi:MAG: DNA-directed RNA polymerase subunit alpha [Candidatus Paceibacterota bacterium]